MNCSTKIQPTHLTTSGRGVPAAVHSLGRFSRTAKAQSIQHNLRDRLRGLGWRKDQFLLMTTIGEAVLIGSGVTGLPHSLIADGSCTKLALIWATISRGSPEAALTGTGCWNFSPL